TAGPARALRCLGRMSALGRPRGGTGGRGPRLGPPELHRLTDQVVYLAINRRPRPICPSKRRLRKILNKTTQPPRPRRRVLGVRDLELPEFGPLPALVGVIALTLERSIGLARNHLAGNNPIAAAAPLRHRLQPGIRRQHKPSRLR